MEIFKLINIWLQKYYWNRPWHNFFHIENMLKNLNLYQRDANIKLTNEEKENLEVAILYHDVIYDPKRNDNEEVSVDLMYEHLGVKAYKSLFPNRRLDKIAELIIATKEHNPKNHSEHIIVDLDTSILRTKSVNELIYYEHGIFKEFQWVPITKYIEKRVEFLEEFLEKNHANHNRWLIDYVKSRPYKIGIYPGSFNPFHIGHHDILKQAEKVFDKVIIARGINPDKGKEQRRVPQYSLPSSLVNCLDKEFRWNDAHQIVEYSGLVTELFEHNNVGEEFKNIDYFLIRGLRNEADVPQEENFRKVVHDINPSIKFSYFFSEKSHISSSMIRGLMKFSSQEAERYIVR
jgi:pantetheine-phosphate adenylyltransferase